MPNHTSVFEWSQDDAVVPVLDRTPVDLLSAEVPCVTCVLGVDLGPLVDDDRDGVPLPDPCVARNHRAAFFPRQAIWEVAHETVVWAIERIEACNQIGGSFRLTRDSWSNHVLGRREEELALAPGDVLADGSACPACMLGYSAKGLEPVSSTRSTCPAVHQFDVNEVVRTWEKFYEQVRFALLRSSDEMALCGLSAYTRFAAESELLDDLIADLGYRRSDLLLKR